MSRGRPEKKYVNSTAVLRVSGFPKEYKEALENISLNMCEDASKILRPVIKAFIDSQPERMKKKPEGY